MQDLLGFGADTRINTPGRATGNWCYRTTAEQIASIDPEKWLTLNRLYSRI
jgi:4-alpha-glucanotransferase